MSERDGRDGGRGAGRSRVHGSRGAGQSRVHGGHGRDGERA
ncbi:hypothetical protein [Micromonospora haikouensis]